jgi:hypothetical protein
MSAHPSTVMAVITIMLAVMHVISAKPGKASKWLESGQAVHLLKKTTLDLQCPPPCLCTPITPSKWYVDCAHRNLTYIHVLPVEADDVNLSYNNITIMANHSFRNNKIPALDISHNNLSDISQNEFAKLKSLHTLDLSNNHLKLSLQVYRPGVF